MISRYILYFIVINISVVFCQHGGYDGNPDDNIDSIQRPCPVYDLNCIRDFFQQHSHCKKVLGSIPRTIVRPQTDYEVPLLNVSVNIIDLVTQVSDTRIDEFYINKETNKLVIAIEYQNVNYTTNKTYFKFHRRAKEPVVTVTPATVYITSEIVTAVIPNINNLQLQDAECTTFQNDAYPSATVTPSGALSTDPTVTVAAAGVFTNLPLVIQELLLNESAFLAVHYIQYTLCDFGLRIP